MEFSVLMSVYSKEEAEFFKKALESVTLEQSLKPSQVVVVEDGPVPEVFDEIISEIEAKCEQIEFTVVKKEQNAGLAAALNTGLLSCKYDWVARMDSDDIAVAQRFEKQVAFILENPDVSVVGSTISEFQNEPGDMSSRRSVGLVHDDIVKMSKVRTPMNHVTVFYSKEKILSAGGYCESFGKLEDYKLWVDLLVSGVKFANIDEDLVLCRVGNGFIERRSNRREISDWDMLQTYMRACGFIGRFAAFKNRLYIRIFIYMPGWFKKLLYRIILRK